VWVVALFTGKVRSSIRVVSVDPRALLAIALGSIAGPFLGVWLSLIATQSALLGIVSTLMALTPIFVLPMMHFIFKEKVTRFAVFGTIVALVGVALLMFGQAGGL
jgi:drug/metabolite transporter (DMT)-like permease